MRSARLGMIVAAVAGSAAWAGEGPILLEDFNDNVLDEGLWTEVETDPGVLAVDETNMRLEFAAAANVNGLEAFAGYLAEGWAIQLDTDFAVSIDWHFDVPSAPSGEAGLAFVIVVHGAPEELFPIDAVNIQLGIDQDVPYIGYEVFLDGLLVHDDFPLLTATDGTHYASYDATADELHVSTVGFQDPNAAIITGMRDLSGGCQAVIWLGGFSAAMAPGFAGDAVFFDNLQVVSGNVTAFCPADLDCEGTVGINDFLSLLALWGTTGGPADLDHDGIVGINDFLALLAGWGSC